MGRLTRTLQRILVGIAATVVLAGLVLSMLWRDRPRLDDVALPAPAAAPEDESAVTATWFGVTTILIDDGRTQILIDGFVTRPSMLDIALRRDVDNDAAAINRFLDRYGIRRLAAVIPVHSHFDHALDIGAIANRTSASILGSETTAQIARGARVREDQIVVVEDGAEYTFGEFAVTFVENVHAPVGWRGSVPLAGMLDAPLALPAPVTAFPAGTSYSILLTHPEGSTLVQGSAGMREGVLDGVAADTVFLGAGMLGTLRREYIERYWQTTVTATGADTVIAVHFDDYTRPFGEIVLPPRFLDNFAKTAALLEEARKAWDRDSTLYLPQFGVPFALYPAADPET